MVGWWGPEKSRREVNEVGGREFKQFFGGGNGYPPSLAMLHPPRIREKRRLECVAFPTQGNSLERYILFCFILSINVAVVLIRD